jgi:hypothetical protein
MIGSATRRRAHDVPTRIHPAPAPMSSIEASATSFDRSPAFAGFGLSPLIC